MSEYPLISCIMPTSGRRTRFALQAIKMFQAQNYPNKELIVIDEATKDENFAFSTCFRPPGVRIISVWDDVPLTIGAKRNLACSLAKGELICCLDDDDYAGPQRLSKQAEPILNGEADCSAMRMSLLLDAKEGTLWSCSDMTHKLCFKQDIHYGTLLFQASYWQSGLQFPNIQVGEDRRFVHALLAGDIRIARIVDPASYIYVLHGANTTSDMRLVHPDGWEQVPLEHAIPTEDLAFYQSIVGSTQHGSG